MTRYERRILTLGDDGSVDVEGRVIAVLDSPKAGRNQITALVEVGEAVHPTTFEDDSEGVGYKKKSTFFCNEEKGDGEPCEREVNEPDETCWQHQ